MFLQREISDTDTEIQNFLQLNFQPKTKSEEGSLLVYNDSHA